MMNILDEIFDEAEEQAISSLIDGLDVIKMMLVKAKISQDIELEERIIDLVSVNGDHGTYFLNHGASAIFMHFGDKIIELLEWDRKRA